jgi:hypothetical protein
VTFICVFCTLRTQISRSICTFTHCSWNAGYDGDRILFFTAAIVVLTLVVNASTTGFLLNFLGMNDLPLAKEMSRYNSINHLRLEAAKKVSSLQQDPFLGDADWNHVRKSIYEPPEPQLPDAGRTHVMGLAFAARNREEVLTNCYQRVMKTEKLSYWHQFGEGLLGQHALLRLVEVSDTALDNNRMVSFDDLQPLMTVHDSLHSFYETVKNVPFLGRFARKLIYKKLHTSFTIGVGFLRAQSEIIDLCSGDGGASDSVADDAAAPDAENAAAKDAKDDASRREHKAKQSFFGGSNGGHGHGDHSGGHGGHGGHHGGHEGAAHAYINDPVIRKEILKMAMQTREQVVELLYLLREAYPQIAVHTKTMIASMSVLSFEQRVVDNLKYVGALEEVDADKLTKNIEKAMHELVLNSPPLHFPTVRESLMAVGSASALVTSICVLCTHSAPANLTINMQLHTL